ncbi:hypothetical protein FDZ71_18710 [bacterium]|jgi:hypothetical protein|nr:MAG: hypothetical protein FDZ71_18710 [bacterium]
METKHDIKQTIEVRDVRYGGFDENAKTTQLLYNWVSQRGTRHGAADWAVEATHMICHKLSRIVHGDPTYPDSWVDIVGYARLAQNLAPVQDFYIECNSGRPLESLPETWHKAYDFSEELSKDVQRIVYLLFWQDLYLAYEYPAYWERIAEEATKVCNKLGVN